MSGYIPIKLRRQIREQFANRCAYCHTSEHLTVAIFEIEHIIPLVASGKTSLNNICLACPTCNRYKWAHQQAEDPDTGQLASLFHPQLERWADHFTWDENATVIVGLTPTGRATITTLKMNRSQLIRLRHMWVKLGEHP